jgi:hypothetical protein
MESQEKDRQKEHYQSKQQKEVVQRQITTAVDCQSSGVHYEEGHKLSLKEQNEDENTNDSSCHPLQNQELFVSPSSTDIRTSAPRTALATTSCYRQDNEETMLPPQLYEQKLKNDEQADLDASLIGSEQADKKQQSKRGSDETAKIRMMMTPTLRLSSKAKKRKPFYRHELLESSDEAPDVEHIVPGINLGRRGDPRMHKAVSVRLANPSMSLLDALLEGGFQFPRHELAASLGKSDRDILDEDGVQLCQRKNQLSRRLRMIRKKREGCSKHDLSLLGTNRNPVLQQEFNPDRLVKPLAAVSKIKQQEQLYTSTQEQAQHEEQQQQEQRALEYKQPMQNYAGWLPPGVFPSFTTSTDSTRSRTVDEFTSSSSYPPQYRHSENTVRNNTSTTTRSLVDLLKENQAQMNTEAMILDLIRGKHDARWNNTNALSRVLLGSSIGQSVYPPSPLPTNPFLEPISQQHNHPTHTTTPNMSSSTLESSYQRPRMQHPLHQFGQESTGTTTRANIIASHPPPAPPPNEQEQYLSNLVAMLASNNHDQNYTFSVPRTLRNQPTFATNEIMNMNATTTNDTIPPHPAPTLLHTFVQQSLIDDKNANMYRLASQLSSFPELMQGAAALGSHHDSIHTTSIVGQLAFEEKLTLAVQIYKSVRKGLIIECLKNAGFAQGDVIDNNELFLMLFERKLNELSQDHPASSGEEERGTSEQEKVLGVKEDDHG